VEPESRVSVEQESLSNATRRAATILALAIVGVMSSSFALAQPQPRSSQLPAPPSMKYISRGERADLDGIRDSKARTRRAIDLATGHLGRAEEFTNQSKFAMASEEFGCYLALVEDTLSFIGTMNADKGKTRDLYRYLDLALRAHIPRLAVMRRTTPVEYAANIRDAEERARDARTRALDFFYGHSILRDDKKPEEKATEAPPGKKQP